MSSPLSNFDVKAEKKSLSFNRSLILFFEESQHNFDAKNKFVHSVVTGCAQWHFFMNELFDKYNVAADVADYVRDILSQHGAAERILSEILSDPEDGLPFRTSYSVSTVYDNVRTLNDPLEEDMSSVLLQWTRFHRWMRPISPSDENEKISYILARCVPSPRDRVCEHVG